MGIDVSHIIRHGFRDVNDREASKDFVLQTMQQLRDNLFLCGENGCFDYSYDEESNEYSFRLPNYEIEFYLHVGCWRIESFFDYYQLFMHDGNNFPIRRIIYDLTRALGESEAWHASEQYTWNGNGLEEANNSFERWIVLARQQLIAEERDKHRIECIPEFNQEEILSVPGDGREYDYVNVYHDSFKECKKLLDTYQAQLSGMRLLGLNTDANGHLRCERNGEIYWVNEADLSKDVHN